MDDERVPDLPSGNGLMESGLGKKSNRRAL